MKIHGRYDITLIGGTAAGYQPVLYVCRNSRISSSLFESRLSSYGAYFSFNIVSFEGFTEKFYGKVLCRYDECLALRYQKFYTLYLLRL